MAEPVIECHTIQVTVGRRLFEFDSKQDWVKHAAMRFEAAEHGSVDTLCVASDGAVIFNGRGFMRAQKRGAYPVTVYSLQEGGPRG